MTSSSAGGGGDDNQYNIRDITVAIEDDEEDEKKLEEAAKEPSPSSQATKRLRAVRPASRHSNLPLIKRLRMQYYEAQSPTPSTQPRTPAAATFEPIPSTSSAEPSYYTVPLPPPQTEPLSLVVPRVQQRQKPLHCNHRYACRCRFKNTLSYAEKYKRHPHTTAAYQRYEPIPGTSSTSFKYTSNKQQLHRLQKITTLSTTHSATAPTIRSAAPQLMPSTTHSATAQLLPSTSRTATAQLMPPTSRSATAQLMPPTSRSAAAQLMPSTTHSATAQLLPSTSRSAAAQLMPSTTHSATAQLLPSLLPSIHHLEQMQHLLATMSLQMASPPPTYFVEPSHAMESLLDMLPVTSPPYHMTAKRQQQLLESTQHALPSQYMADATRGYFPQPGVSTESFSSAERNRNVAEDSRQTRTQNEPTFTRGPNSTRCNTDNFDWIKAFCRKQEENFKRENQYNPNIQRFCEVLVRKLWMNSDATRIPMKEDSDEESD